MIIIVMAMRNVMILKRIAIPLLNVTAVNSHAVFRSGMCSVEKVADTLAANTFQVQDNSSIH